MQSDLNIQRNFMAWEREKPGETQPILVQKKMQTWILKISVLLITFGSSKRWKWTFYLLLFVALHPKSTTKNWKTIKKKKKYPQKQITFIDYEKNVVSIINRRFKGERKKNGKIFLKTTKTTYEIPQNNIRTYLFIYFVAKHKRNNAPRIVHLQYVCIHNV